MIRRMVLWRGLEEWTAEAARVEIGDDGLRATGTQLGSHRLPYRLDYALDATGPGFATRHLRVAAAGENWRRSIDLLRDETGRWHCNAQQEGEVALAAPGLAAEAAAAGLAAPGFTAEAAAALGPEALDCDLGLCPLTNLMPIRRHALDRARGAHDFTMAWVSVPDLAVHADRQRYEHLAPGRVAFSQPTGFAAELELDDDGLVVHYPQIAERV
ncbi:putative glycolipid-binding domain-containing protein [Conexibacter arvalis]|uniref:putative glycolipid-binding domain-containing protein n=1 Tax=Conexibacter arvalis TaxID=912552 RepID=UPI0031B5EAE0